MDQIHAEADRCCANKALALTSAGLLELALCSAHFRNDLLRVGMGFPKLRTRALSWTEQRRRYACDPKHAL